MKFNYKTEHVCPTSVSFDYNDGVITNIKFRKDATGTLSFCPDDERLELGKDCGRMRRQHLRRKQHVLRRSIGEGGAAAKEYADKNKK